MSTPGEFFNRFIAFSHTVNFIFPYCKNMLQNAKLSVENPFCKSYTQYNWEVNHLLGQ